MVQKFDHVIFRRWITSLLSFFLKIVVFYIFLEFISSSNIFNFSISPVYEVAKMVHSQTLRSNILNSNSSQRIKSITAYRKNIALQTFQRLFVRMYIRCMTVLLAWLMQFVVSKLAVKIILIKQIIRGCHAGDGKMEKTRLIKNQLFSFPTNPSFSYSRWIFYANQLTSRLPSATFFNRCVSNKVTLGGSLISSFYSDS